LSWWQYIIWWIQYGRIQRRHTAILFGENRRVMTTAILMDDQNENLSLALVDDAGNPVGALPPGVTVTWAIKSDPNSSPSVMLTPSADTLSCNMKATGMLATGVVISAIATLPPATTPEEADLTVNVVVSAATGFSIVPGTPSHN
jgi:hypothetical protein